MNRYCLLVLLIFVLLWSVLDIRSVNADLPLQGKVIVVDAGHGGVDKGCSYNEIYESDINLKISLYLEEYLNSMGASVILTRDSDKDLSNGVTNNRKRTDFDNRIEIINRDYVDMYLSIHINYLSDTTYFGPQVFYNSDNLELAESIQEYLNTFLEGDRVVKQIPSNTYMYKRLSTKGVLVECGFLSNTEERELLVSDEYQELFAKVLAGAVANYYN